MAGKYITEKQVKLYMKYRKSKLLTQEACAAKAGISTRSAGTIERNAHHTQRGKKARSYKTRKSPIDQIWQHELVSMLEKNPELQPKTLLLYLQRTYQDEVSDPLYDDSILRTLQRRVSFWQAQHGQPNTVIFPQIHLPGVQSLSDFTHMDRDEILIKGISFSEEQKALKPLPGYKTMDYELLSTKISNLSLIVIKNMTYSVPSRLAGHTLTLHLYQHKIEGYLGSNLVICLERKYRHIQKTRYVIDYRHIVHALIKKPGAFRFCQYRDELLPNESYQQIWKYLDESESKKVAPKIMLRLLELATDYDCEYELGEQIISLIQQKTSWDIETIECHFNSSNPPLPQILALQHTLAHYDQFIPNQAGDVNYATI